WLILGQAEAIRAKRERWTTHIYPGAVAYQKPLVATNVGTVWQTGEHSRIPLQDDVEEGVLTPAVPLLVRKTEGERPNAQPYLDAVEHFRLEQYAEAERLLSSILAQQPEHAAAHVLAACIQANHSSLGEAHRHLDTALRLDSLQADAYYLKGILHL